MKTVKWKQYNSSKSIQKLKSLNELSFKDFSEKLANWSSYVTDSLSQDYVKIRNEVISEYNVLDKIKSNLLIDSSFPILRNKNIEKYSFDLEFGLALHKVLYKYGFTERQAGNIKIWNYLTVEVFLDYINYRQDSNINENMPVDKIIGKTISRTKLSVYWWYINLSLQFDNEENPNYDYTSQILEINSTDTIMQLVDRIGSGYYIEFTRLIMEKYYIYIVNQTILKSNKVMFFRHLMILHLSLILEIDPNLMENKYEEYCQYLLKETKRING